MFIDKAIIKDMIEVFSYFILVGNDLKLSIIFIKSMFPVNSNTDWGAYRSDFVIADCDISAEF